MVMLGAELQSLSEDVDRVVVSLTSLLPSISDPTLTTRMTNVRDNLTTQRDRLLKSALQQEKADLEAKLAAIQAQIAAVDAQIGDLP